MPESPSSATYRGRLAPTPTGFLHLGHARTFYLAWQRARAENGVLIYREEDLDPQRCKPEFAAAALEELRWLGLDWDEGPDIGGPFGPYRQSQRRAVYLHAWQQLHDTGAIYPCDRSRRDVREAARAPHDKTEQAEPIYPPEWRPPPGTGRDAGEPAGNNWRFRVPDGRCIQFSDTITGPQSFIAGEHFGDFVVWRRDDVPAYELAVVADDIHMRISEVVRGRDLLLSTARQLLLYEALGTPPPAFAHAPLVCDRQGQRLAKRHAALSLRTLRERGHTPQEVLSGNPQELLG